MGSYVTVADIREELTVLPADPTYSDAKVETRITRAESRINSCIGAIYSLPLASVPGLIESLALDITCYLVLRGQFANDNQNMTVWDKKYKESTDILESIKKGETQLVDDTTKAELGKGSARIQSNVEDYHPTFNVDNEKNWNIDSQHLDAIDIERSADG